MKLRLSESSIVEGIQGNCFRCPVATEMERLYPGAKTITVGLTGYTINEAWWPMPEDLIPFIKGFDRLPGIGGRIRLDEPRVQTFIAAWKDKEFDLCN